MNNLEIEISEKYEFIPEEIIFNEKRHLKVDSNINKKKLEKSIRISKEKISEAFKKSKEINNHEIKRELHLNEINEKYNKFLKFIKERHFKQFDIKPKKFFDDFNFDQSNNIPSTFITENQYKNKISHRKIKSHSDLQILRRIFDNDPSEVKHYNSINIIPFVINDDLKYKRVKPKENLVLNRNIDFIEKTMKQKFRSSFLVPNFSNDFKINKNREFLRSRGRKSVEILQNEKIQDFIELDSNIDVGFEYSQKLYYKDQAFNFFDKPMKLNRDHHIGYNQYLVDNKDLVTRLKKSGNNFKILYKNTSISVLNDKKKTLNLAIKNLQK